MFTRIAWFVQVLMQADPFLSELTNMYERSTEKGSVWVTMKRCECSSFFPLWFVG